MKILCLFDYVARTGFGTVSKNIVRELRNHYRDELQLDIIAINYFGEPFYEDKNTYVISAIKNDVQQDPFGRYFFLKVLKESNDYDGIFICQDLGVIVSFMEVLEHIRQEKKDANKKVFKSIFYFPVDNNTLIYPLVRKLEFFDRLITYTEFGRKEVQRLNPKVRVRVVPHGHNFKDYYPLEPAQIETFKKEYFGENRFIITNVNRNQPRKDLPNTIFGFIEAKKIWDSRLPKPFLYLHTHPKDPMGWDIRAIMLQTDLVEDEDYKLLPKEYEDSMCPTETLNQIINASDVFLTTTLGEGWGLTFTEAAACKVPIIAPYTTSFVEMSDYGKNAFMLYNFYPFCNTFDNVIREQTDINEIAERLLYVASCKHGLIPDGQKILNEKVDRAYRWVKLWDWKEVCKTWIEHFKIYK